MQKYGLLANQVIKEPFVCLICEESAGFNWSDLHGEVMCNRCGTPYWLLNRDQEGNLLDVHPRFLLSPPGSRS